MKNFHLLLCLLVFCCCTKEPTTPITVPESPPNILLIIADDLGKDATPGYPEGGQKPSTPNLTALTNDGLRFTNFWANPTCSPTRAAIITGKYGYRTGVKWAGDELSTTEKVLQRYIDEETNGTYASAVIGKWHLSGNGSGATPESFGLEQYSGLIRGTVSDYFAWPLTENGAIVQQTDYTSKVFTDLSLEWINAQTKPWFLWLAYNAPHTPFHVPPAEMHAQGDLPAYNANLEPLPYYFAAIEAMDYQIGQLLEGIPVNERENTIILFVGDNGTPNQVAQSPYSNNTVKGTLYQGGVNVPLIVSGKGVTRSGVDNNLVGVTDLFSTIAELAGVGATELHDSKSFKGLLSSTGVVRDFQYAEMNDGTNDQWAISNGSFKLIVDANGTEELYQLSIDPYENNNLLNSSLTTAAQQAKIALENELARIRE